MAKKEFKIVNGMLVEYRGNGGDIVIPEGVHIIDEAVFFDRGITSVVLPETLKEIKYQAFARNNIKEIRFPKALEEIGTAAFSENCIKKLYIPENIKEIGPCAFSDNYIIDLELSNNLNNIWGNSFTNNYLLKVEVPSKTKHFNDMSFDENTVIETVEHIERSDINEFYQKPVTDIGIRILSKEDRWKLQLKGYNHLPAPKKAVNNEPRKKRKFNVFDLLDETDRMDLKNFCKEHNLKTIGEIKSFCIKKATLLKNEEFDRQLSIYEFFEEKVIYDACYLLEVINGAEEKFNKMKLERQSKLQIKAEMSL